MKSLKLLPAALMLLISAGATAAGTATTSVNFTATVSADCSVSLSPDYVDFGTLKSGELAGKSAGEKIDGTEKNVTITAQCYGTDVYVMKFVTGHSVEGNGYFCANDDANKDVVRFCLDSDSNTESETGSRENNTWVWTMKKNAFLQRGAAQPEEGDYTAAFTIMISPG
ncbi:MAG: hypothetical protein QM578_02890 [Pantoea sp.]|uniref:hypothetical protein n=1 Tax=Pantoea sp. TaxID=69393 RepID=UPI0039E4DD8D